MKMPEFTPPIMDSTIASLHATESGNANRATVEVVDASGTSFMLTVEAADEHDSRVIDEPDGGEDAEPVFILPGKEFTADDLDSILSSVEPPLLARFLVEQEVEEY